MFGVGSTHGLGNFEIRIFRKIICYSDDLVNFPNIDRWRESLFKRKAVKKAYEIAENKQVDLRNLSGEEWRRLFGTTKPE